MPAPTKKRQIPAPRSSKPAEKKPAAAKRPRKPDPQSGEVGIRVRMYRVGFGDCFLLTLPAGKSPVHVLIDCGVFKGTSQTGDIGTLTDVVANIIQETGGRVGLLVVTHRHADHIAGFSRCRDQFKGFSADAIWFPVWESEYDVKAKKFQEDLTSVASGLQSHFAASIRMGVETSAYRSAESMMFNATGVEPDGKGGTASNATSLVMLKNDFGAKPAYYKANDTPTVPASLAKAGLTARIFGPPPVDDIMLMKLMDLKKGVGQHLAGVPAGQAAKGFAPFDAGWTDEAGYSYPEEAFAEFGPRPKTTEGDPEVARRALQDAIGRAQPEAALVAATALNQFLNNQSLVILFTFQGKNLLFAGDAQGGNWEHWLYGTDTAVQAPSDELSAEAGAALAHLDLYKVGHHGSTNATPIPAVKAMADGVVALCSTEVNVYGDGAKETDVPRGPLLDAIAAKGTLIRSDSIPVTVNGTTRAATVPLPNKPPTHGRIQAGKLWIDYFL